MHTLDSLIAAIVAMFAAVECGGYIVYRNWRVYRALHDKLLRSRVAWTATLIFFLAVILGMFALQAGLHFDTLNMAILVGNSTGASTYVVGDLTMRVARKYDFSRKPRAIPERLAWKLSPIMVPWGVSIWFVVPFLNVIFTHPLLVTLSSIVLPIVGSFIFWPIVIAGLLSAARWVPDFRLRENMRSFPYLILNIGIFLWSFNLLFTVLQAPPLPANAVISVIFLAVTYTSYKSCKSLVMTHKLPAAPQ